MPWLVSIVITVALGSVGVVSQSQRKHTYLALGDSYTIGEKVDPDERWPNQLVKALEKKGIAMDQPEIIARTGWTTAELNQGIHQAKPHGPYDLVSLLIGVNNQYRQLSVDVYRKEFHALLEQSIQFAGGKRGHVFVVSIPDWGVTPFAIGRDRTRIGAEIDQFNSAAAAICKQEHVPFVDITPYSRKAASQLTLVAADGLHPSGKMYAGWVRIALPVALEAIRH
jgi:lysophospholipase L1-like esterase